MHLLSDFHRLAHGLAGLVLMAVLAGCAPSGDGSQPLTGPSAQQYLFDHLQARRAATEAVWVEQSFTDLLPNHLFRLDGAAAEPLVDGLVLGEVVGVEPGRGYLVSGDDAAAGTEGAFDDPDARWRTVDLTVHVGIDIGDLVSSDRITVIMAIDGGVDATSALAGFAALETVLLPLDRQGAHAYSPDGYSLREGDLLAVVDDDGSLRLPALSRDGDGFLGALDSVDDVLRAAAKPAAVESLQMVDGVFVRESA